MLNNATISSERFVKAATSYLSRKGYSVQSAQGVESIDLVAVDECDNAIALVALFANEESFDDSKVLSRECFENAMLELSKDGMLEGWEDMRIRFDTICIRAFGDKALLRHRVDAPLV